MIANKILARHVVKHTGFAMFGALFILLLLQLLFGYLAELGDLSEHYRPLDALRYVLWDTPYRVFQLLPIAGLMGAVVGLGSLATNSELVVMRASGVSLWRIVGWTLRPALILVVCSLLLREWVIPQTNEYARAAKQENYVAKLGEVRGYWTKQDNQFVYIDYANANGELKDLKVLSFDENLILNQHLTAQHGQFLVDKTWQLHNVNQVTIASQGQSQSSTQPEQAMALVLQPQYVHMVTADPEDLAPSQLVKFMRYLDQSSQIPRKYQLAFWQMIAAPFALIALVVMACSFIFGPLRQHSMGFRLVIALFIGLGFYYFQDFIGYASLVASISVAWFVLLPIFILLGVGTYLLHRVK
ncbi:MULTISPECIES: LPS export ABC transporter permease LptG [unclassified Acinetobacter]|uniref:LPS export ABC transporter permease LptG n=1 Tax=unclassified Acinetobacter TaxID=196816 RepID=UPI0035B70B31